MRRRWWESWSAPKRLRAVVETAIAAAVSAATALGIPAARYTYEWERAVIAQANNPTFAAEVPARAPTDKRGAGQVRRAHLARVVADLRNEFVWDARLPVFWAGITRIAKLWGVEERQARTLLAQAEAAGLLYVVRRWREKDHDDEEPRTNVYVLTLPGEAWRFYVEKRRALASAPVRAAGPTSTAEAVNRAREAFTSPTSSPSSPRRPASPPRSDLWVVPIFAEERGRLYQDGDPGTARPERLERVQELLRDEAAAARAWAEAQGLLVPRVDQVAAELARDLVRAWLRRPGSAGFLGRPENAHRLGFWPDDVNGRALADARERWQREHRRRSSMVAPSPHPAAAQQQTPPELAAALRPTFTPSPRAPGDAPAPIAPELLAAASPAQVARLEALLDEEPPDEEPPE